MARKNRPVLFEVVARTQRSRRWSAFPRRGAPGAAASAPAPAGLPVVSREALPGAMPGEADAGWYIVLRLGWPHLVVVAALLLVLLFACYQVGRRSVSPPTRPTDDLTVILAPEAEHPAPKSPPAPAPGRGSTAVVTPLTPPPLPQTAAPTTRERPPEKSSAPLKPAATFTEGAYYVVVQYFSSARKKDAEDARDFLKSKGVDCVVHQGPARDWQLVATEGFPSAQQAQRLVARIRELGKEYFGIGRYDFRDPVARKF